MALRNTQYGFFARNRWLVWTVGIIAAIVLLAAFMSMRNDQVPVRVATIERGTIRSVVSTNGKVEPIDNFEAHAPIGTTVKRVLVKEGDHVKKGELLVQLNDYEARNQAARAMAQVRAAEADQSAVQSGGTQEEVLTLESELAKARTERDAARRNLQALKKLQQTGAASPGEVKVAQDRLEAANADLTLLEQKKKDRYSKPEVARVQAQGQEAQSAYAAAEDVLKQLEIRAPFDGEVYSIAVHEGNYVNPGDLILQEADLSKLLVRAYVDEPDIGRLSPGDPLEITWDAIPGRVWQGKLNAIPSTVKLRGTRNVGETTSVINNHDFKLLPNINVGVTIVTSQHKDVLVAPREAVRQSDSKSYVYQVVDNQLQRRDVGTAISNLTQVEITNGVSAGSMVALASTNTKPLKNGLEVKVVR
jgi:HlyD family secretion protein